MRNLIRTEWLKMKNYRAFWWLLSLTALAYPGINFIFTQIYKEIVRENSQQGQVAKMLLGNPFEFPEAWHTVAFFSSFFVFIPAVLIIMFITNEYNYRTHRQNIIDGWSRSQFITSKLIDVLIICVLITLLYFIVSLITGYSNYAWHIRKPWSMVYYTGLFMLQTFSQLTLAFLCGFLIRKAFIALGVFLFYYLIFEPILVQVLKRWVYDIGKFLPLEISDRLIPVPAFLGRINEETYKASLAAINIHILYTILLTSFIWWICYRVHARKDL